MPYLFAWRRMLPVVAFFLPVLVAPRAGQADEPRRRREPYLLNEPGEVTNVYDAFDEEENGNPFDISLSLGLQQSWYFGNVTRETSLGNADNPGLSTGGFVASTMNVARFREVTTRFNPRLDVGLYKDIAAYIRLPIILSNTRELSDLKGSVGVQDVTLLGAYDPSGNPNQLFRMPFQSPSRRGIEYLALGADFGIFTQTRDRSKPTWLVGGEVRINVSDPQHACSPNLAVNANGSRQVACANPSSENRTGVERGPGVSRGTTGLELHTVLSKRIHYVEPYGGFRALFEFANDNSDYSFTNVPAVAPSAPPLQGSFMLGLMTMPYEDYEEFRRLTFDARITGTYRSEGRDSSPLFDALGSSSAPGLRRANYSAYEGNSDRGATGAPSLVNTSSPRVYTTGLTDVAAHGRITFSGSGQYQINEFFKVQAGAAFTWIQSHAITGDQPCNSAYLDSAARAGPCQAATDRGPKVSGIPNPAYRAEIDAPGRRFFINGATQIDLWLSGVVMF